MRKILIVEDDRELNQGISYALGQGGYLAIPAFLSKKHRNSIQRKGRILCSLM